VSLRKQSAGVEGNDLNVDLMMLQHVKDHLILEPETRREDDRSGDLKTYQLQSLIERQWRERRSEHRRPRLQLIQGKRIVSARRPRSIPAAIGFERSGPMGANAGQKPLSVKH
jgi:hypothetical protein